MLAHLKIIRKNQLFNVTRAASFFCFLLKNLLEKDVKKRKISRRIPPVSFPSPFYDPGLLYKTPHSPQHHNHPFTPTLQTFTGHPSLLKSPSPSLLKAINQSLLFTCTAASSIKEGPTWKLRHHLFPFMDVRCIFSFRPRVYLFYLYEGFE